MRIFTVLSCVVLGTVALASCGSDTGGGGEQDLPRVLSYGDSIRGGYEPWLRSLLSEEAEVWTPGIVNGKGSDELLATLLEMPPNETDNQIPGLDDFAVFCLNAGIWDGDRLDANFTPRTNDQYQENLLNVLNLIFERNPSAEVVLVTSTPPNLAYPGTALRNSRISGYNSVLKELAAIFPHVSICDLHQFVVDNADASAYIDGLHFSRDFNKALGGEVYLSIHNALLRSAQTKLEAPDAERSRI